MKSLRDKVTQLLNCCSKADVFSDKETMTSSLILPMNCASSQTPVHFEGILLKELQGEVQGVESYLNLEIGSESAVPFNGHTEFSWSTSYAQLHLLWHLRRG